ADGGTSCRASGAASGRPHFIGGGRTNPASIVSQVDTIANIAPGGAIQVLHDALTRLASHGGTTLSIGFLVSLVNSLWFTNSGVSALFDALNIVYEEKEKRGLIKYYLETLTFTIATIIFVLLSIAIVVAIPVALSFMPLPGGRICSSGSRGGQSCSCSLLWRWRGSIALAPAVPRHAGTGSPGAVRLPPPDGSPS